MPFLHTKSPIMKRKTFSNGEDASHEWDHLIQNGELEKAYRKAGVLGVMGLTGLRKTQSYLLVAKAGLNRSVLIEKTAESIKETAQRVLAERLKHVEQIWGWVPGQEFCHLKGKVYCYKWPVQLGGMTLHAEKPYFIASLPGKAVMEFMEQGGLKFFIANHKVLPFEEFKNRQRVMVQIACDAKPKDLPKY